MPRLRALWTVPEFLLWTPLAALNVQGILLDSDPAAWNHKSCPPVFLCCVPLDSHNFGTRELRT